MLFKATPAKAHTVNGSICRMAKICNKSNVIQAYLLVDLWEQAYRCEVENKPYTVHIGDCLHLLRNICFKA
jgi:hypothetical protein